MRCQSWLELRRHSAGFKVRAPGSGAGAARSYAGQRVQLKESSSMSSDFPGNDEQRAHGPADPADPADWIGAADRPGDTIIFGPASRAMRSRRPFIVAGVAVAALLGGAGVAYAVSNSGASAQVTAPRS